MSKSNMKLPRWSVIKAIAGALIMFSTLALLDLGFDFFGIFNIALIVIGGALMKDYFREIGFNS